jgi:hypothetical protein
MSTSNHPGVHRVARILSRRDGLSLDEAIEIVLETQKELIAAAELGDLEGTYDIMSDNLGLEPDYIDDLIFSQI